MLPKPMEVSALSWRIFFSVIFSLVLSSSDVELSVCDSCFWRLEVWSNRIGWSDWVPDRLKIFNAIDSFSFDVVPDFCNWNACNTFLRSFCVSRLLMLKRNCPRLSPLFLLEVCPMICIFRVSCSGFATKKVKPCSQMGVSVSFLTDVNRSVLDTVTLANGSGLSSGWIWGKSLAESRYTHKTALLIFDIPKWLASTRA